MHVERFCGEMLPPAYLTPVWLNGRPCQPLSHTGLPEYGAAKIEDVPYIDYLELLEASGIALYARKTPAR